MSRKQALEEFLNDEVTELALGLYLWHGNYYEVVTYNKTLKRHNWSQYVTIGGGYKMREASEQIVRQYYPEVWKYLESPKPPQYLDTDVDK